VCFRGCSQKRRVRLKDYRGANEHADGIISVRCKLHRVPQHCYISLHSNYNCNLYYVYTIFMNIVIITYFLNLYSECNIILIEAIYHCLSFVTNFSTKEFLSSM